MWCLPAGSVEWELRKERMAFDSTSSWEKAVLSPLILIPHNSVPPCMSLLPFDLLPQCLSSEQVNPSKPMCGPFKRNTWDPSSPVSHSTTIPIGFHSQQLWELLFLALETWNALLLPWV